LFDLIRHEHQQHLPFRHRVSATPGGGLDDLRKFLTELLQSSLTNAKHQKNIEIDLLFRLAILNFITASYRPSSPT